MIRNDDVVTGGKKNADTNTTKQTNKSQLLLGDDFASFICYKRSHKHW